MDIEGIVGEVAGFLQANTVAAIAIAAAVLILIMRKSKGFWGTLVLLAILAGIFYLIYNMGSGGLGVKDRLIKKSVEKPGSQ